MTDDLSAPASGSLEELCRDAERLIAASPGPVRRVRVQSGDVSLEIEWPETAAPPQAPGRPDQPSAMEPGMTAITAPLLGTFYCAPSPGATPFVQVGDLVQPGQQIAIIEAMKLMNAVEADQAGRVAEVLVADGSPVEYGETLFVLSP
jgi:acetyl-CoA carboxylase biotin carboxyl carrier protein